MAGIRDRLVEAYGCSLSWLERDGWISYPTSSDMGYGSARRDVDIGQSRRAVHMDERDVHMERGVHMEHLTDC